MSTHSSSPGLKLNLGAGANPLPGYINVDKFGAPDVLWDLEEFPWPWQDNAVQAVVMSHVLEHLGQTTTIFLNIIKELYRVCRHDAIIDITVPHPRSDDFLNDPTHVRPVTPEMLTLFSKRMNHIWQTGGAANSTLGLYLDVDFEIQGVIQTPSPQWAERLQKGAVKKEQFPELASQLNNVISFTQIKWRVNKTPK